MIALYLTLPGGRRYGSDSSALVGFPIGVPDASLEEFVERLWRDDYAVVTQFWTGQPDQGGRQEILRSEPLVITPRGVATIRNSVWKLYHVAD